MMLCKVFNCFEAETYLASCDQSDLVIEIGDVLVGMETFDLDDLSPRLSIIRDKMLSFIPFDSI
jgi:hypothetical protein